MEEESEPGLEERLAVSTNLEEIITVFTKIKTGLGIPETSGTFGEVFSKLQDSLSTKIPHRYSSLFQLLKQRSTNKEYYDNKLADGLNVLIIGKKLREIIRLNPPG